MKRFPQAVLFIMAVIMLSGNGCSQKEQNGDFLTRAIDKTVNPGTDFFKYATGTWMKENPIPASERGWGIWNLVQEETYDRIKTILNEAEKSNAAKGTSEQKVGDYFATGMDSAKIESQGITPLKPELDKIAAIQNQNDLFETVALLQKEGVNAMFNMFVSQDDKNSDQWAMHLWQGGLGLPNREYYFRKDERTENIRKEYKIHIAKMLALLGEDEKTSVKNADDIYAMEIFLADSCKKLEDLRDPYANYNKMSLNDVEKISPKVQWNTIFSGLAIDKNADIIVGQPGFYKRLSASVSKYTIDQWKEYLKWHLVNSFASNLSSSFDNENFHFKGAVMNGVKEQKPRWKRVQDAVENAMGELLGQVYVKKYYSPKTKQRYEKLVDNIIDAFRDRIKKLDWMSESTKEKAIVKLNAITKKVGYPDKWKDFSNLSIDRDSYLRNTINANVFWTERDINKLGKPVDRTEWDMTPQTYNAYYNPSNNEIVLPAAMFIVPGVPDSLLDDAVIYSYAGASTIGHELTHGFDDEGRQYDAKGNLENWWTKDDEVKFNERTKLLVDQFDGYVVLDSMHINGKATLGENLADLGGILIGYDAFMKTEQYKEDKPINGLTPKQRFWLGFAYSWLGQIGPERIAQQVMTDVHSPNFLRVNGPFSDVPAFYDAFNIKEGDKMWLPADKRVKVW